jgi:hypothetical protein
MEKSSTKEHIILAWDFNAQVGKNQSQAASVQREKPSETIMEHP